MQKGTRGAGSSCRWRTTATGAGWNTQFILHKCQKNVYILPHYQGHKPVVGSPCFLPNGGLNIFLWFPGERKRKSLGSMSQLHWLGREMLHLERNYNLLIWYFWHRTSLQFGFTSFCLLYLYCAQQIKDLLSSASGINGLPIQQQPAHSASQIIACARAWGGDVCLCSAACDTEGRGLSHLCYPSCLKHLCLPGCLGRLGVSWVTSVRPLQSPEIYIGIYYISYIYVN